MEISIIPESAPFNLEQRAWLNGFLAGWLGLTGSAHGAEPLAASLTLPQEKPAPESEPEPWHDPGLAIADRMKLAEGEPLPRRLMAAMAQLDCGACGYLCRTYSSAIASGSVSRLTLCSPGGTETAKALKRIVKETPPNTNGTPAVAKTSGAPTKKTASASRDPGAWSRENPYLARVLSRR